MKNDTVVSIEAKSLVTDIDDLMADAINKINGSKIKKQKARKDKNTYLKKVDELVRDINEMFKEMGIDCIPEFYDFGDLDQRIILNSYFIGSILDGDVSWMMPEGEKDLHELANSITNTYLTSNKNMTPSIMGGDSSDAVLMAYTTPKINLHSRLRELLINAIQIKLKEGYEHVARS